MINTPSTIDCSSWDRLLVRHLRCILLQVLLLLVDELVLERGLLRLILLLKVLVKLALQLHKTELVMLLLLLLYLLLVARLELRRRLQLGS